MAVNGYVFSNYREQRLPPTLLQLVALHGRGGILSSDERISLVPELNPLAGLFAYLRQLGRGVLNATSPVNGRHAPGEVRRTAGLSGAASIS
jgi:hypothetical protein